MPTPTHWERLWPVAILVALVALGATVVELVAWMRWRRLKKALGPHGPSGPEWSTYAVGGREVTVGLLSGPLSRRSPFGQVVLSAPCHNGGLLLQAWFPARPRLFRKRSTLLNFGPRLWRVDFPGLGADVYVNHPDAVAAGGVGSALAALASTRKVRGVVTGEGSAARLMLDCYGVPSAERVQAISAALSALAAAIEESAQGVPNPRGLPGSPARPS